MPSYLCSLILLLAWFAMPSSLDAQAASENAEARVYFKEGNRLFEEASQAEKTKRAGLLRRALESYVDSLRIVRSRNALFNAAIVLEELDRDAEAFNYYTEYLRIPDLEASDREEGTSRREALRPKVAVVEVRSEPAAAKIWIDRRDLAPLGVTPAEVALSPGDHKVFVEKEGYEPTGRPLQAALGETTAIDIPLTVIPVIGEPVQAPAPPLVDAPSRPRLRNAAIGTAASAVAVAATGLGLALRARTLRDESNAAGERYEMTGNSDDLETSQALADRTDRFNIAADVMWGTSIALGISAIVLYAQHRKRTKRERAQVGLSVGRHGAFASVRMPIGGAR